jgi:RND superfamily putative drug exporter
MGQRLPWLVAVVVAISMLLLTVVFRSVVVAIKAAVMNLLSISAAYGVLVMVSQHGWGARLFGFPETMPVTTWVPVFLFVILFGLSMDYEVFLLSRIRENYDATGDNAASVARGLASTARVITAAAAIMVVVFMSFVLGADMSVKQVGLGLAVAVAIDDAGPAGAGARGDGTAGQGQLVAARPARPRPASAAPGAGGAIVGQREERWRD